MNRLRRGALLPALLAAMSWAAAGPYQYVRAGHAEDRRGAVQGGFALMGGGADLDAAFQWLCQRAGGGDFLVLRASGTDAYNGYIEKLCPAVNSVATLILPSRAAAQAPFAKARVAEASALFIAGGDQANYVNFWGGTGVQSALNAAIRRGVPLGGTSAGLAVMGEFAYSAQHDRPDRPDLTSARALANPDDPQIALVHDFLRIPALRGLITDTHFRARDRLGRLLVFMADSGVRHGLGVDQHTALLAEPDGEAQAAGSGAVYALAVGPGSPQVFGPMRPLTWHPVTVVRLTAGQHFDLKRWRGDGARYTLAVRAGVITSSLPTGIY